MKADEAVNLEYWDEHVTANPDGGNVLQCRAFAETKARFGWTPVYQVIHRPEPELTILGLTRRTPVGRLSYYPKGPGVTTVEQLARLLPLLKMESFLIKVEPEIPASPKTSEQLRALGLVKARDLQYNWATVIVDLKPDEETIINSFRQKTRYNIRLAERKGITVEPVEPTDDNFRVMYRLMEETTKRAGVFLRSYDYFSTFWKLHAQSGCGQLFLASFEGQVLAGAYVTYLGRKALYKDGGSIREHSELQAPYLLQWQIMRWLKQRGVTEYDLHGTPPADRIDDATHPLAGLARFKTGFQGQVTEYVGTWDLPLDPRRYWLWRHGVERLVTGYYHRMKGELFY